MPDFSRELAYDCPLVRGSDVLYAQRALRSLGFQAIETDGLFGIQTASAVREFQKLTGLPVTGKIDGKTWSTMLAAPRPVTSPPRDFADLVASLSQPQQFRDSVTWRLTGQGIAIGVQAAYGTPGEPRTILRILDKFGPDIDEICTQRQVPVELIVATIATESGGDPNAKRREPGWKSEDESPDRVSLGLMQTLISTARSALGDEKINAEWLFAPKNSIQAGTAYIASQFAVTGFDPPKVACAYNAGGLFYNPSPNNRWRMRQYPIGTSVHADRFIAFFNDCFAVLRADAAKSKGPSFAQTSKF